MKQRVLIVPSYYPTVSDPVPGIFFQEQALALSATYDVVVLMPLLYTGWRRWLSGFHPVPTIDETLAGVRVMHEQGVFPTNRWPNGIDRAYDRLMDRGFGRLAREGWKPDLIHAFVVYPAGRAAVRLGQRQGLPVILTEVTGPLSIHLATTAMRRRTIDTLARTSAVIAVGPRLAREMESVLPGLHVQVIAPVIRTEQFVPPGASRTEGGTRFLGIGRLTRAKGFHVALQAARRLLDQGRLDFSIDIVGVGPERDSLLQQIADLGVATQCRLLGSLERTELVRVLHGCDALISPSVRETFGVALAEAMACGKPVLATRTSGAEFVVTEESGLLTTPEDADELAAAMVKILDRTARFDPARIRASVEGRFGTQVFLQHVSAVYDSVRKPP